MPTYNVKYYAGVKEDNDARYYMIFADTPREALLKSCESIGAPQPGTEEPEVDHLYRVAWTSGCVSIDNGDDTVLILGSTIREDMWSKYHAAKGKA